MIPSLKQKQQQLYKQQQLQIRALIKEDLTNKKCLNHPDRVINQIIYKKNEQKKLLTLQCQICDKDNQTDDLTIDFPSQMIENFSHDLVRLSQNNQLQIIQKIDELKQLLNKLEKLLNAKLVQNPYDNAFQRLLEQLGKAEGTEQIQNILYQMAQKSDSQENDFKIDTKQLRNKNEQDLINAANFLIENLSKIAPKFHAHGNHDEFEKILMDEYHSQNFLDDDRSKGQTVGQSVLFLSNAYEQIQQGCEHEPTFEEFQKEIQKDQRLKQLVSILDLVGEQSQKKLTEEEALEKIQLLFSDRESEIQDMMKNGISILEKDQDPQKANRVFDKILKLDQKNSEALAYKGGIYYQLSQYELGVEYCQKAIQKNQKNVIALNYLGLNLHELQRYDEAIVSYDSAIQINPKFIDPQLNKAKCLIQTKKSDNLKKALEIYNSAIEQDPQNANLHIQKGDLLFHNFKNQQDSLNCVESYNSAIQIDGSHGYAYLMKGGKLMALEQYQEALENLDLAIKYNTPCKDEAYSCQAHIYADQQEQKKEIQSLFNAIKIYPEQKYLQRLQQYFMMD